MVWHLKPCYSWWRDRIRSWSPLGHWLSPTLDGTLLGRPPGWYDFPIWRQFWPSCVLPWARIGADQIQKPPPLPNLVVSVQHPEIQSIQKGKYFYKQFPPASRRPVAHLISEPGGEAFVEPQVAPPTHCHQVAKPLMGNVQWTIGQCPVDNWTIGSKKCFSKWFCHSVHLMCQFMCNNIGNPLLCTGICFLFGVEHLENGDNPDFHPDLNYLR